MGGFDVLPCRRIVFHLVASFLVRLSYEVVGESGEVGSVRIIFPEGRLDARS